MGDTTITSVINTQKNFLFCGTPCDGPAVVAQITATGPVGVQLFQGVPVPLLNLGWSDIEIEQFDPHVDISIDSGGVINTIEDFPGTVILSTQSLTSVNLIAQGPPAPELEHTLESKISFQATTTQGVALLAMKTMTNGHVKTLHGEILSDSALRTPPISYPGVYVSLPFINLSTLTPHSVPANITLHQAVVQVAFTKVLRAQIPG
jgi:hypothetical protein